MDFQAASALVDHIAGCCGGFWEPSTKEAWIEAMLGIGDARFAEDAARLLAQRWAGPGRPSFGDFKAVYDTAVRQEVMRRALPPGAGVTMALLDFLLLRAVQAEAGDRAARHDLETWRKMLSPESPLRLALPGIEDAREWFASHPDALVD